MNPMILMPFMAVLTLQVIAAAQNFAGQYALDDPQGRTTMVVQQAGGKVTGNITMDDGSIVNLDGEINGNEATGIAASGEKSLFFKLHFQGAKVIFTMIPVTGDNQPDMANAQQFPFVRQGGASEGGLPAPAARGNLLGGGRDPFTGEFSDSNIRLQLTGGRGLYQGQIQFQGQTFPASAESSDDRNLTGKFTSGTDSFEFTGSLQGSTLTFITGGTTYQLRKQGSAQRGTVNPLGGGAAKSNRGTSTAAPAQPIAGGDVVNDPSMGVRFSVPSGWKHQKQQANYIVGHDTIPGMILILPHTSNSVQELAATASEPLYQAEDGQLAVSDAPVTLANNMIAADYGGSIQGKQTQGRIVGVVSPFGGGFLIMAGTDVANYGPRYAQMAESVARSMSFSKPQAPPEAAMWKQKFSGMRVTYFKSGGSSDISGAYSWSDRRDIDLCSNGAFMAAGGFEGSLGTADASAIINPGTNSQSGQWAIIGQAGQPALQLRHASGKVETFVLSTDGSKTFLDGVRWYVVENPTCQ